MDMLKNFSTKDFVEQVTILENIEKRNIQEAIPALFDLCKNRDSGDQALFMAENALRTLLSKNEDATTEGLGSDSENVRKICLQIIGQKQFTSAADALVKMVPEQKNTQNLFEVLSALAETRSIASLDIFQQYMYHEDPLIAELSIEALGKLGNERCLDQLFDMISDAESDSNYETCSVITASALEALGQIGGDRSLTFLSSKIHHRNPCARRITHMVLTAVGQDAIPYVKPHFDQEDIDQKIMAANVLGMIGGKNAGEILVNTIDTNKANHPNILFAIYEALGNCRSMKSLICLVDGLQETDALMLIAVVTSLNSMVNPGVMDKIKSFINTGDQQSQRIIKAIVTAKATTIFQHLYSDETIAKLLIDAISTSNNADILYEFSEKLKLMDTERSIADSKMLDQLSISQTGKRILAVDDSKAMLLFYQSTISEMGISVVTAMHGQEALEILKRGEQYNLIISDMNMPVMDGVEFTKNIRLNALWNDIPIVMVTTESESSQMQLAKKAGIDDFMKKPFPADVLQNKIENILA